MAEIIVRSSAGSLSQEILAGPQRQHRLWSDEPKEQGGEDRGPNPYDLLLAALGSCTGLTLQVYARKKNWDLKAVSTRLTYNRIHAEDCANCETKEGYIDRITREITLEGDLSEAQRSQLLLIARRCPVHKTLTSEIVIEDRPPEVRPLHEAQAS
jgi:putative redox protein